MKTTKLVINAQGLTKCFGQLMAVVDLNLAIQQGESFALVGPDGAGKTTVLRMCCGIMDPDAGQIKIFSLDFKYKTEYIKDLIGYMPQQFSLYDDLTVAENLAFYADIYRVPKIKQKSRIPKLMAFSGLSLFKNRLAKNLSGGMRQKLSLICALIHKPKLLILDEPTCGVDPISRREFWLLLQSLLNFGLTILLSTAYLDEAERATRVGLIHQGRLLLVNTPKVLKAEFIGKLIELHANDLDAAYQLLATHPLIKRILLIGDRIIITVNNLEQTKSILYDYLIKSGLNNVTLKEIQANLEDRFIQLIDPDI